MVTRLHQYKKLTQRYTENALLRGLSLADVASRTGICKTKTEYMVLMLISTLLFKLLDAVKPSLSRRPQGPRSC